MERTILVVEDDEQYRNILEKELQSHGYKVEVAANGEEGIKKLDKTKVDLILLDLIMPEKGGWTFMNEINATRHKNIPIIILTNLSEVSYPDQKENNIYDVMVKANVSLADIIETVNNKLNNG